MGALRSRASVIAALFAATLASLIAGPVTSARAEPVPVRILTLGDSISEDGRWQDATSRLLFDAGIPNTVINVAVSGTRCSYWPERIDALLATHQPDLVVLMCGTNDDPTDRMPWGESRTGWSTRYVIEAVHAYRPMSPARTLPALIGYSDPLIAPTWLLANQPATNDNLWSNQALYLGGPQLAGIANLQVIPGTADYITDDGIHPNARGHRVIGRMVYDAARASQGWPLAPTPPPCGMYGHRRGGVRPYHVPCPLGT